MDTSRSLKTLNITTPLPFNFRSRASLLRPFCLSQLKKHFNPSLPLSQCYSPFCSQSGRGNGNSLPDGVGKGVNEVSRNKKLLQVVLVSPQIPGNTGCIARTCAATSVGLHLVGPLGFQVDDAKLKRAGLDYWPFRLNELLVELHVFFFFNLKKMEEQTKKWYVVVKVHDSWAEFQDYFRQQEGDKRLLAFTKRGTTTHSEFSYRKGDYLVFGSETSGLPPEALLDCKSEMFGGGMIRIPMVETYVRCLNLSVSVGIALYEASRQLNYEQLQFPSEDFVNGREQSFITEDIFA